MTALSEIGVREVFQRVFSLYLTNMQTILTVSNYSHRKVRTNLKLKTMLN